jgi:predicted small lipoprotein YifL
MLRYWQILVSAIVLAINVASVAACGQQGALYLPAESTSPKVGSLPEKPVRSGTVNDATPVTDPNQQ